MINIGFSAFINASDKTVALIVRSYTRARARERIGYDCVIV